MSAKSENALKTHLLAKKGGGRGAQNWVNDLNLFFKKFDQPLAPLTTQTLHCSVASLTSCPPPLSLTYLHNFKLVATPYWAII